MVGYIPYITLSVSGLICLYFLVSVSGFTFRQKQILSAGGALCALFSFGLLYELRGAEHWTTVYILVAFICFWWFTSSAYLEQGLVTRREAALVILWGQATFPLLMAIALIW